MKCTKCNGFMFVERYYDYFLRFDAWKCINCGNIVDSTIHENRQKAVYQEVEVEEPVLVLEEDMPAFARAE